MPAVRMKTQTVETSPNNSDHHLQTNNENKTRTPKISLYEQSREERIKENLERMQQLGLKDRSNSLLNSNSHLSSRRGRPRSGSKPPVTPLRSSLLPSGPLRRSSRLQNTTPVSYSEVVLAKKDELLEDVDLKLKESEVYTEEHEKLLGNTERIWTLFVDGCGSDGRRIYDPVKGKTCHQCRQKTLGHRTHCSKCGMVQGQFCGDCLYMRYGEHVLEAIENPNWVCPVCRGICNCSLCRQAKGWAPTGSLYRKISQMGFKSVAHYLIQTRRVQTNNEKNPDTIDQVSAKRSLSFPALELPSKGSSDVNNNQPEISNPQSGEDGLNCEKKDNNAYPEPNPTIIHQNSARKPLLFSNSEAEFEEGKSTEINLNAHGQLGSSESDSGKKRDDGFKCEHEKELHFPDKEPNSSPVTLERYMRPGTNHAFSVEPSPDNAAERHGKDNSCNDDGTMGVNDKVLDVKETANHVVSEKKQVKEREHVDNDNKGEGYIASESSPKLKKRPASAMGHSPDSIAERMKQRRRQGKDHDEQVLAGANESVSDAKQVAENTSSGKESEANLKRTSSGTNVDCIARRLRPRKKLL
ncbi:hypothetical protein QUC31_003041 [Theobroma cacao]|uniref:Zinc-finger domain of monoamine-oxidase A repressor R1, putative n=1 Tax=Theobroma cacao TaxID=3641 RepID=A0A061DG61_THECC|nr:Zinc-finger domain of monoamine-oxidase A repressor R1, putative [Theobroma cacao]WRX08102.1 Zinc-finger domain of monoamine-oxidase A repressor R1 - like 1 [Theobroma cacao]